MANAPTGEFSKLLISNFLLYVKQQEEYLSLHYKEFEIFAVTLRAFRNSQKALQ
jgi:hypothetical protein